MNRLPCIAGVLTLCLVCGACSRNDGSRASNDSRTSDSRYPVSTSTSRTADSQSDTYGHNTSGNGDRSGYSTARSAGGPPDSTTADWHNRNDSTLVNRAPDTDYGNQPRMTRASWGDGTWNESDIVKIKESEMPSGVRSSFSREAGYGSFSDAGRGTWNGKTAYCGNVMKNGYRYQVISDPNGDLLAMRRVD